MHLLVAGVIATLPAGRIHNDFAVGVAGSRIECDAAASHLESAMNGMQYISQRPLDLGLGRVEINPYLLCGNRGGQQQQPCEQGDRSCAERPI